MAMTVRAVRSSSGGHGEPPFTARRQDGERVDGHARDVDLDMDVGPGRVAGEADGAQDLARDHVVADADRELRLPGGRRAR